MSMLRRDGDVPSRVCTSPPSPAGRSNTCDCVNINLRTNMQTPSLTCSVIPSSTKDLKNSNSSGRMTSFCAVDKSIVAESPPCSWDVRLSGLDPRVLRVARMRPDKPGSIFTSLCCGLPTGACIACWWNVWRCIGLVIRLLSPTIRSLPGGVRGS